MKTNKRNRKIISKSKVHSARPILSGRKSPSPASDDDHSGKGSIGEREARPSGRRGRHQVPASSSSSSPTSVINPPSEPASTGPEPSQGVVVERVTRRFSIEHNTFHEYGYYHSRHPDRVTSPYPLAPGMIPPILGDIYVHQRAPKSVKFKPHTLHAFQAFYWSSANTWKQILPERMSQEQGGYFHPNRMSYPMARLAYADKGQYILKWITPTTTAKALRLRGREYRKDPPVPNQPDPNNFDDLEEGSAGGEHGDDDEHSSVAEDAFMEQHTADVDEEVVPPSEPEMDASGDELYLGEGDVDEEIVPSSEPEMEISGDELDRDDDIPMEIDPEPVDPEEVKELEPDLDGDNDDVEPQDMDDDNNELKRTLENFQKVMNDIIPSQSDWETERETAHEPTDATPSIGEGTLSERETVPCYPVAEGLRYRTPGPSMLMDHDVYRPVIALPPRKRLKTSRDCLGWLL